MQPLHHGNNKPLLNSGSRTPSPPGTPVAGGRSATQLRSSIAKFTVAACGILAVALVLLRAALAPARLHGPPPGANLTDWYLREQGHLFLHAAQRCRSPSHSDSIPQLQPAGSWEAAARGGDGAAAVQQGVTLATQLSMDRLGELEAQCRSWPHALAAAVYVPLVGGQVYSTDPALAGISLEEAQERLAAFHARLGLEGSCALRLKLFTESFDEESSAGLYPFNAMRNRALQLVETEAVLLLDTDMLVSRQFGEEVGTGQGWAALRRQLAQTPAVALPAFQLSEGVYQGQGFGASAGGVGEGEQEEEEPGAGGLVGQALQAAEAGKDWVGGAYLGGVLLQYPAATLGGGDKCTQHAAWAGSSDFYSITYLYGCEPYVVMLREHVPWYDERFRGYGFDKMIHYVVMWQWGVRFAVHPRAYLVHAPHPAPTTLEATQRLNQGVKLKELAMEVKRDLEKHRYYPVTGFEEGCLLRPQRQQRRRNHIHRRGPG